MSLIPAVGARLCEAYEALRRQVLDREANRGWGLSLFLSRGMTAWANVWAASEPGAEKPRAARAEAISPSRALLPEGAHDVIKVLAAMVFALQREVTA